eukprot:gene27247-biopygen995
MAGDVECIKSLLGRGADVNAKDIGRRTPLHYASRNGDVESCKVVLDSGAEVDAMDNGGGTPLHYASIHGQVECLKALLECGADVTAKDIGGGTPLHDASRNGHVECVETLLANGAGIDEKDASGRSPSDYAAQNEHAQCLKAFLDSGAEELRKQLTIATTMNDELKVQMACMTGQEDVVFSQDLETLELLLANVDLECLRKAILEKRVLREHDRAHHAALESALVCGVVGIPKDKTADSQPQTNNYLGDH